VVQVRNFRAATARRGLQHFAIVTVQRAAPKSGSQEFDPLVPFAVTRFLSSANFASKLSRLALRFDIRLLGTLDNRRQACHKPD
jgi:hypothetical protein